MDSENKVVDNKNLDKLVKAVDYNYLNTQFIPSANAIMFINFIKQVNGAGGEENKSPVIHMDMVESVNDMFTNNLFVSFRGSAKTSVLHEYLFLFIATYGKFFDFGKVEVAMYVSDTIDNGVASMRKNLEFRYDNSDFLQKMIPETRFTNVRWEFTNLNGGKFCVRGFGANTGVRGFKEYGKRPTWCGMDDLMSDKNAESPTIVTDINNIIYKAARQAMHPKKRKIVWTGTPFNKKDPLYQAAGSSSWNTRVYPICEKFPCTKEEFRGAWEDRFPYEFVKAEYEDLLNVGKISAFNQELMLRIASSEDRLIKDEMIGWFEREELVKYLANFNIYITTDFAVSEEEGTDFSTIGVFAYDSEGRWYLIDGICKRQTMDKNIEDLFSLVQRYRPISVGVEISGQQKGFISMIEAEMLKRNVLFNLASNTGTGKGIRPAGSKFDRFHMTVVPWFSLGLIMLPSDMKNHPLVVEMVEELESVTMKGFRAEHDDACDLLTMLSMMNAWKPSRIEMVEETYTGRGFMGSNRMEPEEVGSINSYLE